MSTARVNLLPHRAEKRKRAKTQFAIVCAMTAGLGLAIVLLMHLTFAERINVQQSRNTFLKS